MSAPEDLPSGQEIVSSVWYALILPGCIGLAVLGPLPPVAIMAYRQAELRKMQARDLRRPLSLDKMTKNLKNTAAGRHRRRRGSHCRHSASAPGVTHRSGGR